MISIIICSVNTDYLEQVKNDIKATIGVEYELLVWDNSHERKGICEVYNLMAEKARYEYLCFLHEDILFATKNWGQQLNSIFIQHPSVGVVGIGGSKYKSAYFSGWYTGIKNADCVNIIHRYSHGDEHQCLQPSKDNMLEMVTCIDGVFIACRKNVWKSVRFDEERITGFHFYDIDFSLRAGVDHDVAVTFEILLIHITKGGDYGNNWVKEAISYYANPQVQLPVNQLKELPANADLIVIKSWLEFLKHYSISWQNKFTWISKQKLYVKGSLYSSLIKFLIYNPLRLYKWHQSKKH